MLELANNQIKSQETEKEPLKIGVCASRKELVGTPASANFCKFLTPLLRGADDSRDKRGPLIKFNFSKELCL